MADSSLVPPSPGPASDPRRVQRACARAARGYDEAAVLQREVARRMLERLDLVKMDPRWVLDLGSGTGLVARELVRRYPRASVLALDLSPAMLRAGAVSPGLFGRLRGRRAHYSVAADMARLPLASDSFDLVCSNMALEWSADPERAFAEVQRCLRPGGLFMFTTVGPDTLKELRAAAPDIAMQPAADMHDIGDALVRGGFAAPVMDVEWITLTYGELRALFADLRACASTSAVSPRQRGLRGRRWLAQLTERYEAMRVDGRLPATVEVIHGHAWKPAARPTTGGDAGQSVIRFHRRERPT